MINDQSKSSTLITYNSQLVPVIVKAPVNVEQIIVTLNTQIKKLLPLS